ncbi:MAG: hypothetical protein ACOCP8_04065 [archaeon]
MKVVKVIIADENGNEQTLKVNDGTLLLSCEDNKVLTQISTNAYINMEVMKGILKGEVPVQNEVPAETEPDAPETSE